MSLKESIAEKHKLAESHPFNKLMIGGKLTQNHYILYLLQMSEIFYTIEDRIELSPNICRFSRILFDIRDLDSQVSDEAEFDLSVLKSTQDYVEHLNKLDDEDLMAHVYLNYLALAFGGQLIKKSVPGAGKMYEFDDPSEVISYVRSRQKEEWADEANLGLDYTIAIYDELQAVLGLEG